MGLEPTTAGATIRSYHQLSYAHHPTVTCTRSTAVFLYTQFLIFWQVEKMMPRLCCLALMKTLARNVCRPVPVF